MLSFTYSPEEKDPESNYLGLVVIDYSEPGDQVQKHNHPVGHWSVVTRGELAYLIDGRLQNHRAPCQVWIPKNTDHQMTAVVGGSQSICAMPREAVLGNWGWREDIKS